MADESHVEQRALADRLVSYSDAIVAVSIVGASGLGVAIADPDARESIATAVNYIIVVNLVSGVLLSGVLLILRRWEADLRSELPAVPKARRYSSYLHIARLSLIWFAAIQSIGLMIAIK